MISDVWRNRIRIFVLMSLFISIIVMAFVPRPEMVLLWIGVNVVLGALTLIEEKKRD